MLKPKVKRLVGEKGKEREEIYSLQGEWTKESFSVAKSGADSESIMMVLDEKQQCQKTILTKDLYWAET